MRKIFFLFLALSVLSCRKKTSDVDQAAKDEQIIKDYIANKSLTATATGTGLYYVINTQGTGPKPNSGSTVTVKYKGYLTDETVFDQSAASGLSFGLGSVIKGWTEGIPLFNEGGKGVLLIPSKLGYGSSKTGDIPANSVLIFDIELLKVQ